MKRNNKNAFTLVELLAVIVILAIILVIAVPQIMNVIKDTTKASFESSAKMVASQVENQYTVAQTLSKEFGITGSCMKEWAGLNETDYESCTYKIDEDGNAKVTLIGKGKFKDLNVCAGTRSGATAVEGECKIKLIDVATISADLEVTSVHNCATSGICEPGTSFAIQVNDSDVYKFYVISDDGSEVTLIMNKNIKNEVTWYNSDEGYAAGPLNALRELRDSTSTWTNLQSLNINTYDDELGNDFTLGETFEMYARLPKYSELTKFGTKDATGFYGNLPDFLMENLSNTGDSDTNGYWFSTAYSENTASLVKAWRIDDLRSEIHCNEYLYGDNLYVDSEIYWGIRPVITLSR